MEEAVRTCAAKGKDRVVKAMVLGVTPEIVGMRWPSNVELVAVDRSREMIQAHWNEDRRGRRVKCLDWFDAVPGGSPWDIVVGDGSFNNLAFPGQWLSMVELLGDHLRDGGSVVARVFVAPPERESPDDVFRDLRQGAIGSFHVFKFRLAMALQDRGRCGVTLGDVWTRWIRESIEETRLHRATGWPLEEIRTIHLYRGKPARLYFPTLGQVRTIFNRTFRLKRLALPAYEMGDRCPTLEWGQSAVSR